MFCIGFDMVNLEDNINAHPILGSAMLACVLVTNQTIFDKSPILLRSISLCPFSCYPTFPFVVGCTKMFWRDDTCRNNPFADVLSMFLGKHTSFEGIADFLFLIIWGNPTQSSGFSYTGRCNFFPGLSRFGGVSGRIIAVGKTT